MKSVRHPVRRPRQAYPEVWLCLFVDPDRTGKDWTLMRSFPTQVAANTWTDVQLFVGGSRSFVRQWVNGAFYRNAWKISS